MSFDPTFYDADYDNEADHYETPKCNNCGESLEAGKLDGDVCNPCYDQEEPDPAVSIAILERSNVADPLNSLVKDVVKYCYKYGCSVDDGINDLDFPVTDDLRELISEAASYILKGV